MWCSREVKPRERRCVAVLFVSFSVLVVAAAAIDVDAAKIAGEEEEAEEEEGTEEAAAAAAEVVVENDAGGVEEDALTPWLMAWVGADAEFNEDDEEVVVDDDDKDAEGDIVVDGEAEDAEVTFNNDVTAELCDTETEPFDTEDDEVPPTTTEAYVTT